MWTYETLAWLARVRYALAAELPILSLQEVPAHPPHEAGAMTLLWSLLSLSVGFVLGYVLGRLHMAYRVSQVWRGR